MSLRPRRYRWRATDTAAFGLIAKEVDAVFLESVWVQQDGTFGIEYDILVPPLVGAVQELFLRSLDRDAEVDALLATISQLTDRLSALEAAQTPS